MAHKEGRRKRNDILRVELENERSSFLSHWRDLGDYYLPRRTRFTVTDRNKGGSKNQKIIDSTGTLAARTLRSGMMAGITSPARPWLKLTTNNKPLAEIGPVKIWLEDVTNILLSIFIKSNLYNILPITYGDLGTFATAAVFMEEDFDDVVRFYSIPIGSYSIANDDKLNVRVFLRELSFTVRQVVMKFGKFDKNGEPDFSNISDHVKSLWENGNKETWVDVCHVVKPNENFDPNKLEAKFKKYSSIYFEAGTTSTTQNISSFFTDADEDKVLKESGYDHFPVLAPRWETTGEDAYGTSCPGMIALGDTKALQLLHKRAAQGLEKSINPAMTGPSSLRNAKPSILPGDMTYDDVREGQKGFRPAHEVRLELDKITVSIQDHQIRIQKAYFENLFLMLANSDASRVTAREIDERHEEKLLGLGPVLESVNQELLDPLVENTFNFASSQGLIPDPPQELEGQDLKIEYISVMAQAQKLAGIASLERFVAFSVNLAKEVAATEGVELIDKLNLDQIIDVYADRMGVDADVIVTDEDVAFIRESRQAQQQAQQQLEMINQGADTAQKLANADLTEDSALKRVVDGAAV